MIVSLQFTGSSQESPRYMARCSESLNVSDNLSFPHAKLKTVSMLTEGKKVCEQSRNYHLRDLGTLLICKKMLNIWILTSMRHHERPCLKLGKIKPSNLEICLEWLWKGAARVKFELLKDFFLKAFHMHCC